MPSSAASPCGKRLNKVFNQTRPFQRKQPTSDILFFKLRYVPGQEHVLTNFFGFFPPGLAPAPAQPKPKPAAQPQAAAQPKRQMNDAELEQFCLEYMELCKDYFK